MAFPNQKFDSSYTFNINSEVEGGEESNSDEDFIGFKSRPNPTPRIRTSPSVETNNLKRVQLDKRTKSPIKLKVQKVETRQDEVKESPRVSLLRGRVNSNRSTPTKGVQRSPRKVKLSPQKATPTKVKSWQRSPKLSKNSIHPSFKETNQKLQDSSSYSELITKLKCLYEVICTLFQLYKKLNRSCKLSFLSLKATVLSQHNKVVELEDLFLLSLVEEKFQFCQREPQHKEITKKNKKEAKLNLPYVVVDDNKFLVCEKLPVKSINFDRLYLKFKRQHKLKTDLQVEAYFALQLDNVDCTTTHNLVQLEVKPIEQLLPHLYQDIKFKGYIKEESIQTELPREAVYGKLNFELPHLFQRMFSIDKLYSHQAQALNLLLGGNFTNIQGVTVTTPTASGKSWIYQLTSLLLAYSDPQSKFLFVFPTKALANDQCIKLQRLLDRMDMSDRFEVMTFDGDCTGELRKAAPKTTFVLTNFDTIHHAILSSLHSSWKQFLTELKLLVIDELHSYVGPTFFHMSLVLRRLLRVCARLTDHLPKLIGLSATCLDPLLLQKFSGLDRIEVVGADGSRRNLKQIVPIEDTNFTNHDLVQLMYKVLNEFSCQTIVFTNTRTQAERLVHALHLLCNGKQKEEVCVYRAGFTKQERLDIEYKLRSQKIRMVVTTSALELGIDIGSLNCLINYQSTPTVNLQQRLGRVGRSSLCSVAFLIHQQPESTDLIVPIRNQMYFPHSILDLHLACAAQETDGLREEDKSTWFNRQEWDLSTSLRFDELNKCHVSTLYQPHQRINLRTIAVGLNLLVQLDNSTLIILEEVPTYLSKQFYQNAIYLNQANRYQVVDVNFATSSVLLKKMQEEGSYLTKVHHTTNVITKLEKRNGNGNANLHLWKANVTTTVQAYTKYWKENRREEEVVHLDPKSYRSFHLPYTLVEIDLDWIGWNPFEVGLTHLIVNYVHVREKKRWLARCCLTKEKDSLDPKLQFLMSDEEPSFASYQRLVQEIVSKRILAEFLNRCKCFQGCTKCVLDFSCRRCINKDLLDTHLKGKLSRWLQQIDAV